MTGVLDCGGDGGLAGGEDGRVSGDVVVPLRKIKNKTDQKQKESQIFYLVDILPGKTFFMHTGQRQHQPFLSRF